jgi:hypothetical protein
MEERPDKPDKPTLLERLSAFLTREPEDREELLVLLHGAYERKLLDADALSMIEGVLQVSEMTVRDIMIPRAQMDVVSSDDDPAEFIPLVLETRHSRFPVVGENKDDVVGILLAKELLNWYRSPGTFNLHDIVAQQAGGFWHWNVLRLSASPMMPIAFLIYFICTCSLISPEADVSIRLPGMLTTSGPVEMPDEQIVEIVRPDPGDQISHAVEQDGDKKDRQKCMERACRAGRILTSGKPADDDQA